MAILRPITEGQVEISLFRDDGHMHYPGSFISSSEIGANLYGGKVEYEPIVVKSAFDPVYYKDLINYCIDSIGTKKGPEDSFTLEISINCGDGRVVWGQYRAIGCQLIGFSLPKFNRESGEVAQFDLTFQPSGITRILT